MHSVLIKNHRGLTSIEYTNFKKVENNKLVDSYDLVITDNNLIEISEQLKKILLNIENLILLKSGESIKTLKGVFDLLEKIDKQNIYPINKVLLIGGASLQDCVATAMSLLKRGTSWDFMPTTFLSQVDSCIGSKTSINSPNTKNIYGLFYPPEKIYILQEFLCSLSITEIVSGYGDAFHYLLVEPNNSLEFAISSIKRFNKLGPKDFMASKEDLKELYFNCHSIKKYYIEIDEFDKKQRKVLNLGHSFGHALESFYEYKIPHGIGVLFGINLAIGFSMFLNELEIIDEKKEKLKFISSQINLMLMSNSSIPIDNVNYSLKNNIDNFTEILSRDKKNTSSEVFSLVLFSKNKFKIIKIEKSRLVSYLKNTDNIFRNSTN